MVNVSVRKRTMLLVIAAGWLGIAMCGTAWASPSGLNNIPTVDVAPKNVLVIQTWGNFADGSGPAYMAGFKYGLIADVEVGIDSRIDPGDGGPLTGQVKWLLPLPLEETPFSVLAGAANISDDSDKVGEVDPYIVSGIDLGVARASLGYSFQEDNNSLFAGLDKTLTLQDRDLVLRGDVRQTDDGDEWLASVGFLHVLPLNMVLESWISLPSESGAEDVLTVKLNYVIPFH